MSLGGSNLVFERPTTLGQCTRLRQLRLEVPSLGIVSWGARLEPQGPWTAGHYELLVMPSFNGVSEAVNPLSPLIHFEVRETQAVADQAEIARRRMMHAYVFEDTEVTAQRIDELLTLYPRSSVAYEIKAELAQRNDRRGEAAALLDQARALIVSGQDVLYLRQRTQADVQRLVDGLTA
jgi:hypothetical protein